MQVHSKAVSLIRHGPKRHPTRQTYLCIYGFKYEYIYIYIYVKIGVLAHEVQPNVQSAPPARQRFCEKRRWSSASCMAQSTHHCDMKQRQV